MGLKIAKNIFIRKEACKPISTGGFLQLPVPRVMSGTIIRGTPKTSKLGW
jgi:hypothetical protein